MILWALFIIVTIFVMLGMGWTHAVMQFKIIKQMRDEDPCGAWMDRAFECYGHNPDMLSECLTFCMGVNIPDNEILDLRKTWMEA